MKDPNDGLEIFTPMVKRGLSEWDVTSGELEKFYASQMTRIADLIEAAPWGDGTEGRAFKQSFLRDGGPRLMLFNGSHIVQQIVEAGPRLRETLGNSLGTDQAIAEDISRNTVRQV
ncbi:hypothetical protein [Streptosporangium amethystogenes]|uniref:hypothetical protein n=1 Tax=Streptosporangium amethystogenes TaxID=2002 RepID=UPI0004CC1D08|nr:hypothetical protein [Streptosporangium amethystogenes]